jgi:S1-C subfamily serine protease
MIAARVYRNLLSGASRMTRISRPALVAAALFALGIALAEDPKPRQGTSLGVETRKPDPLDREAFGIEQELAGRPEGRVVTTVARDSAAGKAGLAVGDLLIAFDGHTLYSQDDLDDALRAAWTGKEVQLRIKRAGSKGETTLATTPDAAELRPGIQWEFAGPAQLEAALALAKKRKTRVMVGVSGAET